MPLDLSYTLFWISLAISAAAVVVFLWLMREGSAPLPGVRMEGRGNKPPLRREGREGEGGPLDSVRKEKDLISPIGEKWDADP